ncbi:MAG: 4-alpha-glucanotransferase [Proteobacteria bacterium]|nr:4-alpha-glucanotransferase [Pseudomonadota bacterium]
MELERCSGVVLHPTALPGPQGIGTLGDAAFRFVDWLASAGQQLWQLCPLGPTGFGNSPYQCFSAFAGNPLLIDLERLQRAGWLSAEDLRPERPFDGTRVDYERVIAFVWARLARAHARFGERATPAMREELAHFCSEQAAWLDDFALFMAIKSAAGGVAWDNWEEPLRLREPAALAAVRAERAGGIALQKFVQYLFYGQWQQLRAHAQQQGVRLVGDLPIYVAYDSAEVWAQRELFALDAQGRPTAVAGVPPDYFSANGQRWGNPLYDWARHYETGFAWWTAVVRAKLARYDLLRIDHFRGFAAYWAIPADEPTAKHGRWEPGPGAALFLALTKALGPLPILAEDLGVITPDVIALREQFHYPGMKILQFAFDSAEASEFRPHTYPPRCVVYTGTHDNDTICGWYAKASAADRAYAEAYLDARNPEVAWDFLRAAWASPALVAMAPLQDVLGLGSEARFNVPGTLAGNWEWRCAEDALTPALAARLKRLSDVCCRADDPLRKPKPRSAPLAGAGPGQGHGQGHGQG